MIYISQQTGKKKAASDWRSSRKNDQRDIVFTNEEQIKNDLKRKKISS